MHLSQYMAENDLSDDQVAKAIGRSRVSVTRYRNGKQRPDWRAAERICRFSNGQVAPNDWLFATPEAA